MNPSIANPTVGSFFEGATVGSVYARCLVAALVIIVLMGALYQAWRMRHAFHLLAGAEKTHATEDQVASSDARRDQRVESSDYWR
jgi:hypothetical protein